jgi:hypothetical protein
VRFLILAFGVLPSSGERIPVRFPAGEVAAVKQVNEAIRALQAPGRPRLNACYPAALANSYAWEALAANPESGVTKALVRFYPGNYVTFYAEVDVRRAARFRPLWSRHIPRPFLRGRKTVQVDIRFRAEGGMARAKVEKALLDGLRVPAALLQLGLRFAARYKEGRLNFFQGAAMPYDVRRVFTQPDQICVQR